MPKDVREFHRPADEGAAIELLRRTQPRTAPLVLGPRVPDELYEGVEAAVDLALLGLSYIKDESDHAIHIGALTPFQDLAKSALLQGLAGGVLAEAAHLAGGNALRQVATVGGALMHQAMSAAGITRDGPPEVLLVLLALDAGLVVHGPDGGRRSMLLQDYLATHGMIAINELLAEITFARPGPQARGALARVARTPRDQAIVAAVAVSEAGHPPRTAQAAGVRLAVAGATPNPVRMTAVEAALAAPPPAEARLSDIERQVAEAMDPRTDFRASAEYRRAMAGVVARRAIQMVMEKG